MSRGKALALSVGLFVIAVGFAVVAYVYLTTTAANLPSFFPGHLAHSTQQHANYGLIAAVVALVAAWFTTAPEPPRPDRPAD